MDSFCRFWVRLGMVFATLLVMALLPATGSAQTFRGTILGTVTDTSGASIVGAKVTIHNVDTGVDRTTETNGEGQYRVPELQIGTYTVTVEKSGFQSSVTSGVAVGVASEMRVDASLKPGEMSQKIEVSGETLLALETTTDVLGGTFESGDVLALPINGRDYTKMLIMVPGALGEPNGAGDSPGSLGQFSVNGNRGRSNNFLLDGTDMNDAYRNLPAINQGGVFGTPGTLLPEEAVAELRILSNFQPEYGRSSGSIVNLVTKSGTNQIHGGAWEYFRNDHLNARNFFNADHATNGSPLSKDRFRNNQFGAALGGPIIKDRTFFYAAYEGQREGFGLDSLNVVPGLSDYATAVGTLPGGNPAVCMTTIIACLNGQAPGVINPVILNFYNLCNKTGKCSGGHDIWPLPNLVNTPISVAQAPGFNNIDSSIVKIDHNFNPSNQLSGRYFFGNSTQSFPLGVGGGNNLPDTNTVSPIRTQLVSISWVRTVSPEKVNEFRFGWNRYRNGFFPSDASTFANPNQTIALNTGITKPQDFGLPTIHVSGFASLGSSAFSNPRNRVDTNWQGIDDFSWKRNRHDLKFGYEFHRSAVDAFDDLTQRGIISFGGLASFLSGSYSNGGFIVGDAFRRARENAHALYAQDSFRWTTTFTLNFGVRWDYFGVIGEDQNRLSVYDPAVGLVQKSPLYPKEFHDFAPRASFAWDMFGKGKTVLRGGFGSFYDSYSIDTLFGQIALNTFNTGPAYNAIGPSPVFITFANNPASTPIGSCTVAPCLNPGVPVYDPVSVAPGPTNGTTDAFTVAPLHTPYIFNYNLNVQHEILHNTVLQVGYAGSAGRKLLRFRDINQPSAAAIKAADLAGAAVPHPFDKAAVLSALAPNHPGFVNQLETTATSNYNSLQASLTQRNWHGWTHLLAYTWSHSIDTASDNQDDVPNEAQPNDSTNVLGNKGPSNFDTRQRLVWSAEYNFPKWSALGRMGEGWAASSVLTFMSGHPFQLNYNFDCTPTNCDGSGEGFGRPDVVGPIQINPSDPFNFLNLNSFAVPCTNFSGGGCVTGNGVDFRHFGNEGRNSILGPDYRNWDLSLAKTTVLTEHFKVLFRVDAFNVTNHPNFANPFMPAFFADAAPNGIGPSGRSSGFYHITATNDVGVGQPVLGGGGQRSLQFAVKLLF